MDKLLFKSLMADEVKRTLLFDQWMYEPVIFVYGTLLAGESNHRLLAGAEFLGPDALAKTLLCTNGRYPAIRRGAGVTVGETYRITLEMLYTLDELENHPFLYQRRGVRLVSRQRAWVYFGNQILTQKMWLIRSGNWRDFVHGVQPSGCSLV